MVAISIRYYEGEVCLAMTPGEPSLAVMMVKLETIAQDVREVKRDVKALTEKSNQVDVWKERIEGRLSTGIQRMETTERGVAAVEKKTESAVEELVSECKCCKADVTAAITFTAAKGAADLAAFKTFVEENYISKRIVLWVAVGAAVAGGGGRVAAVPGV